MIFGIGKSKKTVADLEHYRRALATAIKLAQGYKIESLALQLPDSKLFKIDYEELAKETAVISLMAAYDFDDFKTCEEKKEKYEINNLF